MSRIGKQPISLPKSVQVTVTPDEVVVKGPKGEIHQEYRRVTVAVANGAVVVTRPSDDAQDRAYHGLYRALLANHVRGVTEGYTKQLEIHGVGYKVDPVGPDMLRLSLGFSHVIDYKLPKGIVAEVTEKGVKLKLSGVDRQLVGQVAAEIRAMRKPEPYKGKGVHYAGEKIVRKAGKTAKK